MCLCQKARGELPEGLNPGLRSQSESEDTMTQTDRQAHTPTPWVKLPYLKNVIEWCQETAQAAIAAAKAKGERYDYGI